MSYCTQTFRNGSIWVSAVHHPPSDTGCDGLAERSDGHGSIEADTNPSAHEPDMASPRVFTERAKHVVVVALGERPGLMGRDASLAVEFLAVMVQTQRVQMGVGSFDLMDAMG